MNDSDKCVVDGCIYFQFGEYETCNYHTEHMKHKYTLLEFMEQA